MRKQDVCELVVVEILARDTRFFGFGFGDIFGDLPPSHAIPLLDLPPQLTYA
jgi:hypothetical protein